MFAIIKTETREVYKLLDKRPDPAEIGNQFVSLYVTSDEASQLVVRDEKHLPWYNGEWEVDVVFQTGTIVPQAQLDAAVARQDALKAQVQAILAFAQSVNGTAFDDLTTNQLKGLLQLLFAINGMIDVNGSVDLSDFSIDTIQKIMP